MWRSSSVSSLRWRTITEFSLASAISLINSSPLSQGLETSNPPSGDSAI
jgi:hypothetical protein